jgi:hypothetical protein
MRSSLAETCPPSGAIKVIKGPPHEGHGSVSFAESGALSSTQKVEPATVTVTSRCRYSIESRFVLFIASLIKRNGGECRFRAWETALLYLARLDSVEIPESASPAQQFSHGCRDGVLKSGSIVPQLGLNRCMPFIANGLVRFEEYEIDCARWQLTWRDENLPLNRKTFDLLLYLVHHAAAISLTRRRRHWAFAPSSATALAVSKQ